MKKVLFIVPIMLFAFVTACGGGADPSNLLLGKWKADPTAGDSKNCEGSLEFGPKTLTRPDADGKLSTIPVTYVTGNPKTLAFPATIYVMTDAGIVFHTTYIFSTKDKMVLDTAWPCHYTRQ